MQDRVLDAANILIDVHPVFGLGQIGWRFGIWRGEASVIPRRIHERIHGVSFALGARATFRAVNIAPSVVAIQRVAGAVERHIVGQLNRQVLFLLWHNPA